MTEAAIEVGPALFFSLAVITVSFLPVFTLEDQQGRRFRPLALTKTFAMAGGALLSVTLVPVLMMLFYRRLIRGVLRAKAFVIALALVILALRAWPAMQLGSEFMPRLNEGTLMYMPATLPGLSVTKAAELLQVQDRIIKSFPDVFAVAVRFIAPAGVSAETGVIMLIYLDHALAEARDACARAGRGFTRDDLRTATMSGAVERMRPKMMTVTAIMAGLLPILWSTGTGSELMRRIAVPMVGGMASSAVLTLLVIPTIYAGVKGFGLPKSARAAIRIPSAAE